METERPTSPGRLRSKSPERAGAEDSAGDEISAGCRLILGRPTEANSDPIIGRHSMRAGALRRCLTDSGTTYPTVIISLAARAGGAFAENRPFRHRVPSPRKRLRRLGPPHAGSLCMGSASSSRACVVAAYVQPGRIGSSHSALLCQQHCLIALRHPSHSVNFVCYTRDLPPRLSVRCHL